MTNKITPCNTLVRPVANDEDETKRANNTKMADFMSMPKIKVQPIINDKLATTGIVKPMLAMAEPSAKLRLV